MNTKPFIWLAGALLAGIVLCLQSCQPHQTTQLRVWALGREGEVIATLLPAFQAKHPGVNIEVQQLPWTAAHEKLLTAYAGDALPDVIEIGNTWIAEFAAINAIVPLDTSIGRSASIHPADYFSGVWEANRVSGRTYGIPWYVDTRLLFYRRDLLAKAGFTQAPRNWTEWQHMLQALKRVQGERNFSILMRLDEFEPLLSLALTEPESVLRDDGRYGNFDSPSFRHAFAFYLDLFANGLAPRESAMSNLYQEFYRGYYAFFFSGPWSLGEIRRRLPAEFETQWATAPVPGPDGLGSGMAGGSSFVICRRSSQQKLAWELIEFLSQESELLQLNALTGDLPARRSVWREANFARDPKVGAFRDQLEHVKAAPSVPEWERIMYEMRIVAEQSVQTGFPLNEAIKTLDERTNAILAKRRWMLERSHVAASEGGRYAR